MHSPPCVLLSNIDQSCVTFVWSPEFDTYVGYRFEEHQPILTPEPLPHHPVKTRPPEFRAGPPLDPRPEWENNWQPVAVDRGSTGKTAFHANADGTAKLDLAVGSGTQKHSWHFQPESDGIRLWLTVSTEAEITGSYVVQQCLRFDGGMGIGFRRTVTRVPFLSELLMQALGNANGTITWARRAVEWYRFPVPFTRLHTPEGAGFFPDTQGETDLGLIMRETAPRTQAPKAYWEMVAPNARWESWSAGLYWGRAAFISNRHPADCLHIGVDFGPLAAGDARTVEGKFYWLEGIRDDLLTAWEADFL